jgi:hypothetical protein
MQGSTLDVKNNICQDCRKRLKDLNIAWIGYLNTFDSIPHSCDSKVNNTPDMGEQ